MASNKLLHVLITFALLFPSTTLSLDAPETSPSPSPATGADDLPSLPSPSPSPSLGSPYFSPPADLSPPLASTPSLSMSPTPEPVSDTTTANVEKDGPKESKSRGMSGGAKAGIAIGVIAAACVVGVGGLLYKKRKQNIQRAQLGRVSRGDFI